jgi:cytochrome P450
MRYAPLPWALPHTAMHDVRYKGIDFAEGDTVLVLVPATNRDPNVMEEPHRFDIARPRVRNFSFGQGAHACPAAQLARIEMAIALERLVTRTTMRMVETPALTASGKGRIPTSLLVEVTKH